MLWRPVISLYILGFSVYVIFIIDTIQPVSFPLFLNTCKSDSGGFNFSTSSIYVVQSRIYWLLLLCYCCRASEQGSGRPNPYRDKNFRCLPTMHFFLPQFLAHNALTSQYHHTQHISYRSSCQRKCCVVHQILNDIQMQNNVQTRGTLDPAGVDVDFLIYIF